ncbi:MAG: hypothetical protein D6E12_11020 [Desulfovibrio sp.]|nr:MAG: hypothetical protein D6E12_11020 [Desulfovibrio sp.]
MDTPQRDQIIACIVDALKELNEELNLAELNEPDESTPLYGTRGTLDSMALVNLCVLVEENIEEELGLAISLTDERAMSQKTSPFVQVKRLARYIETLLQDEQ